MRSGVRRSAAPAPTGGRHRGEVPERSERRSPKWVPGATANRTFPSKPSITTNVTAALRSLYPPPAASLLRGLLHAVRRE